MQRARIEENPAAAQQRRDKPGSQTKGVKQRQCGHKTVFRREIRHRFNLLNVRQQRVVAVYHAFRCPFRAGGKENNRIIFRLLRQQCRLRRDQVTHHPQFVFQGNRCFCLFQIDPVGFCQLFRQMCHFAFFQKLARGDDGSDPRRLHGIPRPGDTRCVVKQCRNTAAHGSAEDRRSHHGGIRQQETGALPLFGVVADNTA